MPKVTVVIPNYNHAGYLTVRIDSVLNQTFQDFEVLYLDDASTDGSEAIFKNYEDHPKIRSIKNEKNSGSPFKQWNKGVREAKGEYVWIAEADDYADPRFLEILVPILDAHAEVNLAYSQSWCIDQDDQIIESCEKWTKELDTDFWARDFVCNGREMCSRFMIIRNVVPNASAVLFRKESYQKVGYADETMRVCGDWKLWAKLMLNGDVGFSAQILNYFRTHRGSVRLKIGKTEKTVVENYHVREFIANNVPIDPTSLDLSIKQVTLEWLYGVGGASLPLRSHLRLYRTSRRLDSKVELRILQKLLYSLQWRLGRRNFDPL